MIKILFVCTGNTCRSPMAEGIFNKFAESMGVDAKASSRGLAVISESGPSGNAVLAAAKHDVDISSHKAQCITEVDLESAELVFGMTAGHVQALISRFPQFADKIHSMPIEEIPDPFGGSLEIYEETAHRIRLAVESILDSLKSDDI